MIRLLSFASALLLTTRFAFAEEPAAAAKPDAKPAAAAKKVDIGTQAPEFKFKDATGKEIDLAELTAKGPVLVRLTCGCSGCDKELAYFQAMHEGYKDLGLTSVAIFREPDTRWPPTSKRRSSTCSTPSIPRETLGTPSRRRPCRPIF